MGFRHVEPTAKAALWLPAFPKNVPGCCWDASNVPSSQGSLRLLIRKKKKLQHRDIQTPFSPKLLLLYYLQNKSLPALCWRKHQWTAHSTACFVSDQLQVSAETMISGEQLLWTDILKITHNSAFCFLFLNILVGDWSSLTPGIQDWLGIGYVWDLISDEISPPS